MSDIVICTGPSGVKIGECLRRLNGKLKRPRDIISIEKKIVELTQQPFVDFLSSPRILSQQQWSNAASSAINEAISSTNPVFLTFHAVYYSQRTRGFLPAVNLQELVTLKGKIKNVLVFIDDVFDIYLRLLGKNEMFEDVRKAKPIDALFFSIINLAILLHWREMEIALSRVVADYVGAPLYVVATKHPYSVFQRLVERSTADLKIYYLSHPITFIRGQAQSEIQPFVGELHQMIRQLVALPDIVLFVPTTIDELAIKMEKLLDGYLYGPELTPRWSVMSRQNIIAPSLPLETKGLNPLNPLNVKLSKVNRRVISSLLEHLWHQIYRQTVSRDYIMVEQAANGVIAIRPFYEGQRAGGVVAEVKHNLMLMKYEDNRSCYVFSCYEDKNKSRMIRIFDHLPKVLSTQIPDWEKKRDSWLENAGEISQKTKSQIIAKLVDEVLPTGFDFQPELSYEGSPWSDSLAKKRDRREIGLEKLWEVATSDEVIMEIKRAGLSGNQRLSYRYLSENDFWAPIMRHMSRVLKNK